MRRATGAAAERVSSRTGSTGGSRSNFRIIQTGGTPFGAFPPVSYTHLDVYKRQRYSRLAQSFPERAKELFAKAEEAAKERYERLVKMAELYKD